MTPLEFLTLHAYEQQVRCQLSPVSLGLLLVDPVPVETKEVNNNLLPYCVIQGLLQIYSSNAWKRRPEKNYLPLSLSLQELKQLPMQLNFRIPINMQHLGFVYKALVFQYVISPFRHEEQHDIEGSGQCKFKLIAATASVSKWKSQFTLVSDMCARSQSRVRSQDWISPPVLQSKCLVICATSLSCISFERENTLHCQPHLQHNHILILGYLCFEERTLFRVRQPHHEQYLA